jgi:hypothetical protein
LLQNNRRKEEKKVSFSPRLIRHMNEAIHLKKESLADLMSPLQRN